MNLHSGFFPACTHRRKPLMPNCQSSNVNPSSLHSARSSLLNENANDSFLPSLVSINVHQDGHRPYRRNDFANNHLFLAKKKLARVFTDRQPRSLQATSDLIHLFDPPQEPKKKSRHGTKPKRQDSMIDGKTGPNMTHDIHLSVVNLALKPPYPQSPGRDPPSTAGLRHSRPIPPISSPSKTTRASAEILQTSAKQQQQPAVQLPTENTDPDGLIDFDDVSDTISTTLNPFDSSLLSIKPLVPIQGNPHVVQHR